MIYNAPKFEQILKQNLNKDFHTSNLEARKLFLSFIFRPAIFMVVKLQPVRTKTNRFTSHKSGLFGFFPFFIYPRKLVSKSNEQGDNLGHTRCITSKAIHVLLKIPRNKPKMGLAEF